MVTTISSKIGSLLVDLLIIVKGTYNDFRLEHISEKFKNEPTISSPGGFQGNP